MATESFWVVFDGPPGPEPGRFVEVENERHEGRGPSHTGASWQHDSDVFWRLGPFSSAGAIAALQQREAHVIEVLREAQRAGGGYGFVRQLLQYLGATEVGA